MLGGLVESSVSVGVGWFGVDGGLVCVLDFGESLFGFKFGGVVVFEGQWPTLPGLYLVCTVTIVVVAVQGPPPSPSIVVHLAARRDLSSW